MAQKQPSSLSANTATTAATSTSVVAKTSPPSTVVPNNLNHPTTNPSGSVTSNATEKNAATNDSPSTNNPTMGKGAPGPVGGGSVGGSVSGSVSNLKLAPNHPHPITGGAGGMAMPASPAASSSATGLQYVANNHWRAILGWVAPFLDAQSVISLRQCARIFRQIKYRLGGPEGRRVISMSSFKGYEGQDIVERALRLVLPYTDLSHRCEGVQLDLSDCSQLKDKQLTFLTQAPYFIPSALPERRQMYARLTSLCLDYCTEISDRGLKALVQTSFPFLSHLSLRGARSTNLTGTNSFEACDRKLWPRFAQLEADFTSLSFQALQHIANFITTMPTAVVTVAEPDNTTALQPAATPIPAATSTSLATGTGVAPVPVTTPVPSVTAAVAPAVTPAVAPPAAVTPAVAHLLKPTISFKGTPASAFFLQSLPGSSGILERFSTAISRLDLDEIRRCCSEIDSLFDGASKNGSEEGLLAEEISNRQFIGKVLSLSTCRPSALLVNMPIMTPAKASSAKADTAKSAATTIPPPTTPSVRPQPGVLEQPAGESTQQQADDDMAAEEGGIWSLPIMEVIQNIGSKEDYKVIQVLVEEYGCELDVEDFLGRSFLVRTVSKKRADLVEFILLMSRRHHNRIISQSSLSSSTLSPIAIYHPIRMQHSLSSTSTPMGVAIETGQMDTIRFLLSVGYPLNVQCHTKLPFRSPLLISCEKGDEALIHLMLAWGANPNTFSGSWKSSPAMIAYKADSRFLNVFLEGGPAGKLRNLHLLSEILSAAITKADLKSIDLLVSLFPRLCLLEHPIWGYPVTQAARQNKLDVLESMIRSYRSHAQSRKPRSSSRSANTNAAGRGFDSKATVVNRSAGNALNRNTQNLVDFPSTKDLLNMKSQVLEDNPAAIHFSAEEGHSTITKFLLEHGALVDLQTTSGYTALHKACSENAPPSVQLLLDYNASVDLKDFKLGETPLMLTIRLRNDQLAGMLLDQEFVTPPPPAVDYSEGVTALAHALKKAPQSPQAMMGQDNINSTPFLPTNSHISNASQPLPETPGRSAITSVDKFPALPPTAAVSNRQVTLAYALYYGRSRIAERLMHRGADVTELFADPQMATQAYEFVVDKLKHTRKQQQQQQAAAAAAAPVPPSKSVAVAGEIAILPGSSAAAAAAGVAGGAGAPGAGSTGIGAQGRTSGESQAPPQSAEPTGDTAAAEYQRLLWTFIHLYQKKRQKEVEQGLHAVPTPQRISKTGQPLMQDQHHAKNAQGTVKQRKRRNRAQSAASSSSATGIRPPAGTEESASDAVLRDDRSSFGVFQQRSSSSSEEDDDTDESRSSHDDDEGGISSSSANRGDEPSSSGDDQSGAGTGGPAGGPAGGSAGDRNGSKSGSKSGSKDGSRPAGFPMGANRSGGGAGAQQQQSATAALGLKPQEVGSSKERIRHGRLVAGGGAAVAPVPNSAHPHTNMARKMASSSLSSPNQSPPQSTLLASVSPLGSLRGSPRRAGSRRHHRRQHRMTYYQERYHQEQGPAASEENGSKFRAAPQENATPFSSRSKSSGLSSSNASTANLMSLATTTAGASTNRPLLLPGTPLAGGPPGAGLQQQLQLQQQQLTTPWVTATLQQQQQQPLSGVAAAACVGGMSRVSSLASSAEKSSSEASRARRFARKMQDKLMHAARRPLDMISASARIVRAPSRTPLDLASTSGGGELATHNTGGNSTATSSSVSSSTGNITSSATSVAAPGGPLCIPSPQSAGGGLSKCDLFNHVDGECTAPAGTSAITSSLSTTAPNSNLTMAELIKKQQALQSSPVVLYRTAAAAAATVRQDRNSDSYGDDDDQTATPRGNYRTHDNIKPPEPISHHRRSHRRRNPQNNSTDKISPATSSSCSSSLILTDSRRASASLTRAD